NKLSDDDNNQPLSSHDDNDDGRFNHYSIVFPPVSISQYNSTKIDKTESIPSLIIEEPFIT
ncbi:unnamed protein product, partial [Rotaria sp. Silwood2]